MLTYTAFPMRSQKACMRLLTHVVGLHGRATWMGLDDFTNLTLVVRRLTVHVTSLTVHSPSILYEGKRVS